MTKLLIIDDDQQVRNMLNAFFSKKGFDVILAADGKEGIDLYRTQSADLVITDLVMPEKEGIETVMELKKLAPDLHIIAISGGGRVGPESYLQIAAELGAKFTFEKPVDFDDLLQAVRTLSDPS